MKKHATEVDLLVVGPGAIGCAVGAAALDAGSTVAFVGRSRFAHLRVKHLDGEVSHDVDVALEPDEVPSASMVALATKAHDSEAALATLGNTFHEGSVVVVLQNGVDHVERVQPLVGPATVVPAVVNCPAERTAPGVVEVTGRLRLTLPESPAAAQLQSCLDGGFAQIRLVDDWISAAWTKLMINTATGAVAVLARRDNRVFDDPEAAELAIEIMTEVANVGRAEGAELDDDLPARIVEGLRKTARHHMSSIVADRLNGRPTEWRIRNRIVVERAAQHGIAVPVNEVLTTLLRLGEPGAVGERGSSHAVDGP